MKAIILSLVTLATVAANAQNLRAHTSGSENLRVARQQMERQTEQTIVEKLEEQRMEDEKRRLQQFETLNFSVVQERVHPAVIQVQAQAAAVQYQAHAAAAQAHAQTAPAQPAVAPAVAPAAVPAPVTSQEVVPVVIAPGYN